MPTLPRGEECPRLGTTGPQRREEALQALNAPSDRIRYETRAQPSCIPTPRHSSVDLTRARE
ncbi:hypothetical protein EYF80_027890 [Liparis tanakae]|uniref:Uncharacterized protein n=1 Tax=Liparis tanakae TaxID=230148 RepID=A0A4Z2HAF7_9TELE|nr:hypothetical protein EYF80_027890 [Liparis tanakae]